MFERKQKRRVGTINRIKVFSNRAMVYLNGKTDKVALCDVADVPAIKGMSWSYRNKDGYAKNDKILMHRFIMSKGCPNGRLVVVDHINRNPLDNRRHNLRAASSSLNIFNTSKLGKSVGVTFQKSCKTKPWKAYIYKDNKYIYLGHFHTKDEAISARQNAELQIYGELKPR